MNRTSNINKNIVLIGLPGCGKTTIGRAAAESLSMSFYDVDEYIEEKEGKLIKAIFLQGEAYFRKLESQAIEELSKKSSSVIATGGGAVKVSSNMEILKDNSIIFFINRSVENIIKDIDTSNRPLLAEGAARVYKLYEERYALYKKYCHFEVLNDSSIQAAVDKIIKFAEGRK
jgi:shikimate kinase